MILLVSQWKLFISYERQNVNNFRSIEWCKKFWAIKIFIDNDTIGFYSGILSRRDAKHLKVLEAFFLKEMKSFCFNVDGKKKIYFYISQSWQQNDNIWKY